VLDKLKASDAEVRAAALEAAGELRIAEAKAALPKLLADADSRVRAAAATAAGKLAARSTSDALVKLAKDNDPTVRRASLNALRLLVEPRAVALAVEALNDPAVQVVALDCLSELGKPAQAEAVARLAKRSPDADVLPRAVTLLSKWSAESKDKERDKLELSLADVQGSSGVLAHWHVAGVSPAKALEAIIADFPLAPTAPSGLDKVPVVWQSAIGSGAETRLRLQEKDAPAGFAWIGVSDLVVAEPSSVQFLAGSNGPLRLWLNGKLLHQRADSRQFAPDADRFDAMLTKGVNRVVVQVTPVKGQAEFHVRFRRKSANHEPLIQAALTRSGDVERGRKLFSDVGKSQCLKCHHLGGQGEKIGPDLTGVGKRFARVYLIESILEPSRTIAPSYETLSVELKDGRVLSGTRIAETPESLTLGDKDGKKHVLAKTEIEAVRVVPVSTMPEGLERPLSTDEFVDLIAFLASQK
jgi:putative heme-binding domain-containing protein